MAAPAGKRIQFTDIPVEWRVLPSMAEPKSWEIGAIIGLDGFNGPLAHVVYVCDGYITVDVEGKTVNVTATHFVPVVRIEWKG